MFLGLDVSTSFIGVSIIDTEGDVKLTRHIDLRKLDKCLFEKAEAFRVFLLSIVFQHKIQ